MRNMTNIIWLLSGDENYLMCNTQVVARESSSWEKKLFLSVVPFKVNFILGVQSQR